MEKHTCAYHTIDFSTIKAIESVLAKGDRVELIPVKDGVKVLRVRREEVKQNRPFRSGND